MAIDIDSFVFKSIGVPFVEHGRDYDGWDCWGLCIRAYKDVLGVNLPDFIYTDTAAYKALKSNFDTRSGGFWQTANPGNMSVACIFRRGLVIHAGLSIGHKILHVEKGIQTCLEPAKKMRIEGYYEPTSHAAASV